ncbi:MAG: hypothetical protein AAFZ15_13630 [Bacteroidota bacterium]
MTKSNFLYSFCLVCTLLIFASCSKDDSVNPDAVSGKLTCKVDGQDWKAETINSIMIKTDQTGVWSKSLNITGTGPDGEFFTIIITDLRNASEGECLSSEEYFSIGDDRVEDNYIESANGIDYASGSSGTFTYTDQTITLPQGGSVIVGECSDKRVSGTFSFSLIYFDENFDMIEIEVTDGKFEDVAYTVQ